MAELSKLTIVSCNVTGLGDSDKRKSILDLLTFRKPHIICLSDTRANLEVQLAMRNELNYNCYFNSYERNSRGVAILFSKSSSIQYINSINDNNGNYLVINFNYEDKKYSICSLYGPSDADEPEFFTETFNKTIEQVDLQGSIIIGDFNTTIDHTKDNQGYVRPRHTRARTRLNELLRDKGFVDTYTEMGEKGPRFTWVSRGGPQKGRLDMGLISLSMKPYLKSYTKLNEFKSDHSAIEIVLDFT